MMIRQKIKTAFQDAVLAGHALVGLDHEYVDVTFAPNGLADIIVRTAGGTATMSGVGLHNLPGLIEQGSLSSKAVKTLTSALYDHHTAKRVARMVHNRMDYNTYS